MLQHKARKPTVVSVQESIGQNKKTKTNTDLVIGCSGL